MDEHSPPTLAQQVPEVALVKIRPTHYEQRRLALAVVLAFFGALFIPAGELSTFQLGRIDALVPALWHGDLRE